MNPPPHNLEAEKGILGSILIDPNRVMPAVAATLHPDHFYVFGNGVVYEAILGLWKARQPIDFLTVCDSLHGKLGSIGDKDARGEAYITTLINAVPTSIHAEHYAGIVTRCYNKRKLEQAAKTIVQAAYDDDASDIDAYATALQAMRVAEPTGKPPRAVGGTNTEADTISALATAHEQRTRDEDYQVVWPWPRMREYVTRWRVAQPAILIAEGGAGKTTFCMAVGRENAIAGGNIFYVHTEDEPETLLLRQIAGISGIPFSEIESSRYSSENLINMSAGGHDIKIPYKLLQATQSMRAWRGGMWFIHVDGKTMPEIIYDLERAEQDYGKPDAVIFDWFMDHKMQGGQDSFTIRLTMDLKELKDYASRASTRLLVAMQTGKAGGGKSRLTALDAFWTSSASHYGKIVFSIKREREMIDGEPIGQFKPIIDVFISKANLDKTGSFKLAMRGETFQIYEPETNNLGYAF